jgi:hypothetical protein
MQFLRHLATEHDRMDAPLSSHRPDLTLYPAGDAFIARLDGAYPIVARLAREDGSWAVSLIGASFNAQTKTVARGLETLDAAKQAAAIALETVKILEARDEYRFRHQEGGPNRWYADHTARQPFPWNGKLPDLRTGARLPTATLDAVLGYLDATFPHLVNLGQHRPHYDPERGRTTDPNEHTIEVLAALDTGDLSAEDTFLARLAVVYHDVGKGLDAYDPRHPLESARLAAPLLNRYGLSPEQAATVLLQIREHDLLGVLSRGRMTVSEAAERLSLAQRPQNLALHAAIATADISTIRGLRWVVDEGRIEQARREVAAAMSASPAAKAAGYVNQAR